MRIGYLIVFGTLKEPYADIDDARNRWEAFDEVCERHGMKLIFWGDPFGVPEPQVFTLKIGSIPDWENAIQDVEYASAIPLENTRTLFVMDYLG